MINERYNAFSAKYLRELAALVNKAKSYPLLKNEFSDSAKKLEEIATKIEPKYKNEVFDEKNTQEFTTELFVQVREMRHSINTIIKKTQTDVTEGNLSDMFKMQDFDKNIVEEMTRLEENYKAIDRQATIYACAVCGPGPGQMLRMSQSTAEDDDEDLDVVQEGDNTNNRSASPW